jgi:hypothetical protein
MTVPTEKVTHADEGRVSKAERLGLASPIAGEIDTRNDAEQLADKLDAALDALGLTLHSAAGETPQLTMEEYLALRGRIKANGQRTPIVITKSGQLVDGRHRLMACHDLGLDPVTVMVTDEEAREAAFDSELRRHQTKSQMAAFTVLFYEDKVRELTKAADAGRGFGALDSVAESNGSPVTFVANTAAVGTQFARYAVALLNAGRIDLLTDVRDGKISSMEKAYQQHLDEQKGGENKKDVGLIALNERLGKVGAAIQKLKTEVEELKSLTYAVESNEALEELITAAAKFSSLYAGNAHEISSTLVPAGYEGSDRERRVEWMREHAHLSPADWAEAYKEVFGNE